MEDQGQDANKGGGYQHLVSICALMQIDANFGATAGCHCGATAGIAEMLLQSYAGWRLRLQLDDL